MAAAAATTTTTTTTKPNPKRVYQVWKGNNRFFCGGRLIFGPDISSLFLSVFLISGPAVMFCIQIFRKINHQSLHNNSQDGQESNALWLPVLIFTMIVLLLDLIFLFLTSSRDPGVIPRNARAPEYDEHSLSTRSTDWLSGRTQHLRLPRTKDVTVNGFTVKVKFCDTCLLYRPPRASHCSICNNCVQKFDHHCPWVDQCIGLRNYRFFFMFISTSTFLCLYVFVLSWVNILVEKKHHDNSLWKSMTGEAISLVLIAYTFVTVWFVGGLTVFHLFLISKNQTTYENFRYRYEKKENPYNKGLLRNFVEVFFSRIPPSMNDFRSWAAAETIQSGCLTPDHIGMDQVMMSSKEKVDVEMGSNRQLGGSTYIETILQNIDYAIDCDIEEEDRPAGDEEGGGGGGSFAFDEFIKQRGQTEASRSRREEEEDDAQVADGSGAGVRDDGGAAAVVVAVDDDDDDREKCSHGTLHSVDDHDVHLPRT